jgi:hypothetical protein
MHSLLGYRYDNLIRKKIADGPEKNQPGQSLSFRVHVSDLARETEFFTRILGITPLVESEGQVILPLSNGIILNLLAVSPGQPTEASAKISTLELDMHVSGIQKAWRTARNLYHCSEEALSTSGTRRTFKVTSPSGIVLRLWQ